MKICHLSPCNIYSHIMNSIPNSAVKTDIVVFFLLGDSPACEFRRQESPKRKNTTFRTRRKFEIKKTDVLFVVFDCFFLLFFPFFIVSSFLLSIIFSSYHIRLRQVNQDLSCKQVQVELRSEERLEHECSV